MVLIKLNSDNFDGELLTPEVYNEVILSMSSGDHATHSYELVVCPDDPKWHCFEYVVSFDDYGQALTVKGTL